MDTPSSAPPAGLLGALRAAGDGLLSAGARHLELVGLELQEEKLRLIQVFLWICAVVFAAMMAITFASLVLVYVFWESARLPVLGGLALFYAAGCAALVIAFRRYLSRQPGLFAATLEELNRDRACIRSAS